MGGMFSSPKPPAPDPSIAESQRKQEDILKKQEKRTAEKERWRVISLCLGAVR